LKTIQLYNQFNKAKFTTWKIYFKMWKLYKIIYDLQGQLEEYSTTRNFTLRGLRRVMNRRRKNIKRRKEEDTTDTYHISILDIFFFYSTALYYSPTATAVHNTLPLLLYKTPTQCKHIVMYVCTSE
jgi:hypothetical protein